MKPLGELFLEKNVIQGTWSGRQETNKEATRQGGAPAPLGPLVAVLTDLFRLYILIYPGNIRTEDETLFPPPQPSVPVRSHLGAFSSDLPEGESVMEGFYINTIASPMMCEQFTTDLRVHSD